MFRIFLYAIVFITFLCVLKPAHSQDAVFSQYYANPVYLNPALAGSRLCPRITSNYRNQWASIDKGYKTYNLSFDMFVNRLSGGMGMIIQSDRAGDYFTRNTAALAYAYKTRLSRTLSVSAALQAGFSNHTIGWDKLVFEDQINLPDGTLSPTSESTPKSNSTFFTDFAGGFVISHKANTYLGAAFHHITQPDVSFYDERNIPLDMRISVHAGTLIDLNRSDMAHNEEEFALSPNIIYSQQGGFHQMNLGMYLNKFPFSTGIWLRHNFEKADALIAVIGLKKEKLRVGYSVDMTLSSLAGLTGGTHEISFAWVFNCRAKSSETKAINCPEF